MEENNKLIAEFMGVDQVDIDYAINEHGQLKYHLSWDWLMPVVNKCLDIYHIEQMNDDLNFKFYDSMGDIKKTYKAVLEFIKDYNKYICGSCGDNCNEYTYNEETDVDECNQCKTISQNN